MSEILKTTLVTNSQGESFEVILVHWVLTTQHSTQSRWTVLARGVTWRSSIRTVEAANTSFDEAIKHFRL